MAFEALRSEMSLDKSDYGRAIREASKETAVFGSVAEDSFEDAGDGAEEAGNDAQDAASGFNRFGDSIRDTIIPTRIFAGAADEAGDEASEAGREAGGAAFGFGALRLSTSGAAFSMGVFSAVTGSTVIALGGLAIALGAVMLALAPLVIGAAAVAAAFGLIVGTGLLAWGKGFQKTLKKVKQQIVPLVKEFGQKFVPFLKETVLMLPGLVKSLLNAVGGMDVFLNALRGLRDFAFKVLPKLVKWFFDLGRWALPILTKIGAFVVNKVVPALAKLVNWGKQVWTVVGRWVKQFQQATAKGTTLRTKVDQLVAAAKRFWKNLQPVIQALKPLARQLIKLAPVIAGVALDVGRLALNIGSKLLPVLVPLINFLTGIFRWFNKLSPGIKRAIVVIGGLFLALGPIISILGTLFGALGTIVSAVGTVIAIFNPLSLAIIAIGLVIAGLAYLVIKHWDSIVAATKSLARKVTQFFAGLDRTIKQWGRDVLGWLSGDFVVEFVKWFVTLHKRVLDKVSAMVGGLMDYLTGRRGPLSNVDSAGQALIDGFINGIKSKIGDVVGTVENVMQSVRDRLPFSPAKYGPLRDLDETGPAFVKTFADGIRNSEDMAVKAVERMAVKAKNALPKPQDVMGSWAGETSRLASGLFRGIPSNLARHLIETFKTSRIRTPGTNRFRKASDVVDFTDYLREAREYGDQGGGIFHEDTASVAFEDLLRQGSRIREGRDLPRQDLNISVTLDTDDEALREWVNNHADVRVNRHVRQALKQANRRRTFR